MNYMLPSYLTTPTHLFDTTVFIDHLRGQNKAATALIAKAVSGEYSAAFSILTDAELWYGVKSKEDDRTHRLLLRHLRRLPLTLLIARRAGQFRSMYRHRSLKIVDAMIAATAEHYQIPVCTYNVKDFEFITEIQVIGY
jgi:tRNA(fMet)-specific endonuclease VapC